MTSLTSVAVAASVLLHTLLGCCMHHGHCSAGEAGVVADAVVAVDDCGHCHDGLTGVEATRHPSTDGQPAPRHDGPHQCEGTTCTFLSGDGAAVDLRRNLVHHWSALDLPLRANVTSPWCGVRSGAAEPGGPPPPDRSRARLCVWLI